MRSYLSNPLIFVKPQDTMFTIRNQNFKKRIEEFLEKQYFMKHMKFDLNRIEPGRTEGILVTEQIHEQQFGRIHGGVIATMADITSGFAAYTLVSEDEHVVTGEIKISYFSKALGPKLRSVGRVIKAGRKVNFCEAEVYNINESGEEKLVAKASTTMVTIEG